MFRTERDITLYTQEVCLKSIKIKAVFTKSEMNNE